MGWESSRIPRDFAGVYRGCPNSLREKRSCSLFIGQPTGSTGARLARQTSCDICHNGQRRAGNVTVLGQMVLREDHPHRTITTEKKYRNPRI